MLGLISGQTNSFGTTPFSSESQKGTNYSDYVGSIVEGYVNIYKTKLEGLGVIINSASLIKKEELETLGCSLSSYSCSSAPSFISSASYWSKSAYNDTMVWYVESNGSHYNCINYYYIARFGVRPVITILTSEL